MHVGAGILFHLGIRRGLGRIEFEGFRVRTMQLTRLAQAET